MRMKRFVMLGLVVALLALAAPVFAEEVIWLDTRDTVSSGDGYTDPVWTSQPLEQGRSYKITIDGTFSVWGWWGTDWCGQPEGVRHPSVGGTSKWAGWDAEYTFAAVARSSLCKKVQNGPHPHRSLQFSLDGGEHWITINPVEPGYRSDHHYTYEVVGRGKPAQMYFRLWDIQTGDNNGRLLITVTPL